MSIVADDESIGRNLGARSPQPSPDYTDGEPWLVVEINGRGVVLGGAPIERAISPDIDAADIRRDGNLHAAGLSADALVEALRALGINADRGPE